MKCQIDLIGPADRAQQMRQKRIDRPTGGQESLQAQFVQRSSVFSQRSDARPGRRSPVPQLSSSARPAT